MYNISGPPYVAISSVKEMWGDASVTCTDYGNELIVPKNLLEFNDYVQMMKDIPINLCYVGILDPNDDPNSFTYINGKSLNYYIITTSVRG